MGKLKPFTNGKKNVKELENYTTQLTGELLLDMRLQMKKTRMEQAFDQKHYDQLKAIEVPWKAFVGAYVVFLIFMAIGSYIFSAYFAVSTSYLVWANILFFFIQSAVLITIFLFAVKQEEVTDTRTLAALTNSINKKSDAELG